MQPDIDTNQRLADSVLELNSIHKAVNAVMATRTLSLQKFLYQQWGERYRAWTGPAPENLPQDAEAVSNIEEQAKNSIATALLAGGVKDALNLFWQKAEAGYFGFPAVCELSQWNLPRRAMRILAADDCIFSVFEASLRLRPAFDALPLAPLSGTPAEIFQAELVRAAILPTEWTCDGKNGQKYAMPMRPVTAHEYLSDEEAQNLAEITSAAWWVENAGYFDAGAMKPALTVGRSSLEISLLYRALVSSTRPSALQEMVHFEFIFGLPTLLGSDVVVSEARAIRYRAICGGAIRAGLLESTHAQAIIDRYGKKALIQRGSN